MWNPKGFQEDAPMVRKVGDGSTLMEWIAKDMRFVITIESEGNAHWYFVTKDGKMDCYGKIPDHVKITLVDGTRKDKKKIVKCTCSKCTGGFDIDALYRDDIDVEKKPTKIRMYRLVRKKARPPQSG